MSKYFKGIILIVLSAMLLTGCRLAVEDTIRDDDVPTPNENMGHDIGHIVDDLTESRQGDILIEDISIVSLGASSVVTGTVTNEGDVKTFNLELNMYNSETNRLLGQSGVNIENLANRETRDFEITIVGDYNVVNNFVLRVIER